jgi:hypothetical protein
MGLFFRRKKTFEARIFENISKSVQILFIFVQWSFNFADSISL